MKLAQSIGFAKMQEKPSAPDKRITASQLTREVFKLAAAAGSPIRISEEKWMKQWLTSDEFILTEMDAGKAAVPACKKELVLQYMNASADSMPPIVVDINKRGIGVAPGGYTPRVIVIEGQERHRAATLQGRGKIRAYVGNKAANIVLSAYALKPVEPCDCAPVTKIEAAAALTQVPRQDRADNKQSAPHKPMPSFVQDRGILSNSMGTVGGFKKNKTAPGTGVGPRIQDDDGTEIQMPPNKGGSKSELQDKMVASGTFVKEMHEKFKAAIKGGYKPDMSGSAPKGWEKTVGHMKSSDNPSGLAHWLKGEGYEPHKLNASILTCKSCKKSV